MSRSLRLLAAAVGLLSAIATGVEPAASAASGSTLTAFAWDGGEGGWLGAGHEAVYHDGQDGAVVTATGNSSSVRILMSRPGATSGMGTLDVAFAPPRGGHLVPGTYEGAARPISARDDQPGLEASHMWAGAAGAGCNALTGRFVVEEATYDPQNGAVKTFAATFQEECEGYMPSVFGEVRFRSKLPFAARRSQLRSVPLVVAAFGDALERTLTITSDGPEPLRTGQAMLPDASATMSIVDDGCSNAVLATGESCDLTVRYRAADGAAHQATLTLPDNTARGVRRFTVYGQVSAGPPPPQPPDFDAPVAADGILFADRTAFREGHWQQTFRDGSDGTTVDVTGTAAGAYISASRPDPYDPTHRSVNEWGVNLQPSPGGDVLEAGRDYIGAVRYPFNEAPEPGVSTPLGCNTAKGSFSIYDIGFDPDGRITRLAAGWLYGCDHNDPLEAGEVRWHSTVPVAARSVDPDIWSLGMYLNVQGDLPRQTVTVTSTGTGPLVFGQAAIEGDDDHAFDLTGDSCSGARVAPGRTCSVTVEYRPRSIGSHTGVLVLPDNTALGAVVFNLGANADRPSDSPGPGGGSGSDPGTHTAGTGGYWMLGSDGTVYGFGNARWLGGARTASAVDLEPTPTGAGYWVVDDQGRVSAFGDAVRYGDVDRSKLAPGETVTSLSAMPGGKGYWVFTSRGRVLPFGDAPFLGDVSTVRLAGPVLDSIATSSGRGYYMVASDGGIFAFGDARFAGSMGGQRLNSPVQSLVPDPDGAGYWLVAGDGGVFAFDAGFRGSMGGRKLNRPITGMVPFGNGYLMVAEDGGIFAFSDLPFLGSLGAQPPPRPIVAVAAARS